MLSTQVFNKKILIYNVTSHSSGMCFAVYRFFSMRKIIFKSSPFPVINILQSITTGILMSDLALDKIICIYLYYSATYILQLIVDKKRGHQCPLGLLCIVTFLDAQNVLLFTNISQVSGLKYHPPDPFYDIICVTVEIIKATSISACIVSYTRCKRFLAIFDFVYVSTMQSQWRKNRRCVEEDMVLRCQIFHISFSD